MKKLIPLFLIFVFCSNNATSPELVEQNKAIEFQPATTTTTTFDNYLAWDNFLTAWEKIVKDAPVLSNTELSNTQELLDIWEWDGDKSNTENQYLYEIQVNGLVCTRLYNSMGWALLDEVHPVEQEYDVPHTYKCDDKGDLYLFGSPFYYQGNWWIYHNIEFDWDVLECDSPCGTRAQNYATKFIIEFPTDLLNN